MNIRNKILELANNCPENAYQLVVHFIMAAVFIICLIVLIVFTFTI